MQREHNGGFEQRRPLIGLDTMFVETVVLDATETEHSRQFSDLLVTIDKSDQLIEDVYASLNSRSITRQDRRSIQRSTGVSTPSQSITSVASSVVLNCVIEDQIDEAPIDIHSEAEHIARLLLPRRFTSNIPNKEDLHEIVFNYSVLRTIEMLELLSIVGSEPMPVPGADQLHDGYQLVKRYTYMGQQPEDDPAFVYGAALTLGIDVSAAAGGGTTLLRQSMNELTDGKYHDFMFLDFLEFVGRLDPSEVPKELAHAHRQIRLLREFNEDIPETDLYRHILLHSELLPSTVRLEAEQQIIAFQDRITQVEARMRTMLRQHKLEVKDEKALNDELNSKDKVLQAYNFRTVQPVAEAQTSQETEVPELSEESRARILGSLSITHEAEPAREPYELYYNGAEPLNISDEQPLPEELRKALGTLSNVGDFMSDLKAALRHLANVDLTNGLVRGVAKYGIKLWVDGERVEIYGYKPVVVQGLSLRSKAGKSIRIIFNREGNKINIIKVLQRDQINDFENSHGIGRPRKK